MAKSYASANDLVHIEFAADGFLIYCSKSGAYKSSYSVSSEFRTGTECILLSDPGRGRDIIIHGTTSDGTSTSDWVYNQLSSDLDNCNGMKIKRQYLYLVTDFLPYGCCLNREIGTESPNGPRSRNNTRPPPRR